MSAEITAEDRAVVEAQLGRPMRGDSNVISRCPLHLPVVVQVPPVLSTGEPFPTLFWLTCPLAHKRIARIESEGGVREADARAREDAAFAAELTATHERYRKERDALIEGEVAYVPRGGVGGSSGGTKCLHAHYAHHRGRPGDNPLGAEVAEKIEPLDCQRACVRVDDGVGQRDPAWREP